MNGLSLRINGSGSNKAKNTSYGVLAVNFPVKLAEKYVQKNGVYIEFFGATTADDQLVKLKIILSHDKEDLDQYFIEFLVNVFLWAPAKHPVKCFLTRHITKTKPLQSAFSSALSAAILALTRIPGDHVQYTQVTGQLATCIENFPTGAEALKLVETEVAEYMKDGLQCCVAMLSKSTTLSPTEKNEIFNLSHSALRILLYILQKGSKENCSRLISVFEDIRASIKFLLFDEDVPMDTKSVCGILLLSMYIAENGEGAWKDILQPSQHSPDLQSVCASAAGCLALHSAIATLVRVGQIESESVNGTPAYVLLTNNILDIGEKNSADATLTLGVTRAVLQIAKSLAHVAETSLGVAIVDSMLVFIWSHLEHYTDSVRHLTAQAMACVVNYCSRLSGQGNDQALGNLFSALKSLDAGRKSYYVSVAALTNSLGARTMLEKVPGLVEDMIEALSLQAVQACVTAALDTLARSHAAQVSARELGRVWLRPVLARVAAGRLLAAELAVLEHVLAALVRPHPELMDALLPHIRQCNATPAASHGGDLQCALMLLSVGRKAGALASTADASGEEWKGMIRYQVLERAAVDALDETRILSLSLIVESQKSTEPFSRGDLNFILYFLKYNINTQSPNFRQLILSHIKKFVKRFDDSYKVLKRQKEPNFNGHKDDYYLTFLEDLRQQCFDSLLQGSNYSRRFVALQTLVWSEQLHLDGYSRLWKEDYIEKLLLHLEDSYENNKVYALEILQTCPVDLLQGKKYSISLEIEHIMRQASSVKPTDCTCAAYKLKLLKRKLPHAVLEGNESDVPEAASYELLNKLLERLKCEISEARESILVAAAGAPMYGLLHCMCYLLKEIDPDAISPSDSWCTLVRDIMSACVDAAACAAPVVNSDSPEGHLPMDRAPPPLNGSPADGSQVTAQMVLLCAWRTVKEVSLLLGEVSSRLTVSGEGLDRGTLSPAQLLAVGQHLTSLLATTKHRGAFEQAYVGLTLLLTRLWRCRSVELHGAPARWLDELMALVSRGEKGTLCATRRGAGVPFMIQALVTTELQVNGNPLCFHRSMSTLLQLARFHPAARYTPAQVETRTHCLNILRTLYRNTTLGESAAAYVGDGLLTAINGFDAPTWPERNSSTLLFSALAVRVFGVARAKSGPLCARNKMTGRIFFLRYPALYDFMLNKLKEVSDSEEMQQLRPSLYPVLLLLARLYPSALEGTVSNLKLVSFVPHVVSCARSCVLQTRRLAARALPALLPAGGHLAHLRGTVHTLRGDGPHNYTHGLVLQLLRLLEAKPDSVVLDQESAESLSESIKGTLWILEQVTGQTACYMLADEYVKVVNLILWKFPTLISDPILDHIETILDKTLFSENRTLITSGKEIFLANALYLYFIIDYKKQAEKSSHLITKGLLHASYEVVLSSLNYLLILHQQSDGETVCGFQEHLEAICGKQKVLNALRNNPEYLQNLCHVLQSSQYVECVQKTLKILSMEKDTQRMIITKRNDAKLSNEEVVANLLRLIETEHENVTHIYLDSLLRFVSVTLGVLSKEDLLEVVRTVYGSSSAENSDDTRAVVVEFLEQNYKELLGLDLATFSEQEKFEYRSTIWSTLVTLLEDDSDTLRQRIADIISKLAPGEEKTRVIPSKSADILRDLVGEYFGDLEGRIAMFVVLALLDFKSEVCLTDDGNDECRVFDQNERYNIFLEETIWTNESYQQIRRICPNNNITNYVKDVVTSDKYRNVIVKLCNNNFRIFEELLADKNNFSRKDDDALNPKIALFVTKLNNT